MQMPYIVCPSDTRRNAKLARTHVALLLRCRSIARRGYVRNQRDNVRSMCAHVALLRSKLHVFLRRARAVEHVGDSPRGRNSWPSRAGRSMHTCAAGGATRTRAFDRKFGPAHVAVRSLAIGGEPCDGARARAASPRSLTRVRNCVSGATFCLFSSKARTV